VAIQDSGIEYSKWRKEDNYNTMDWIAVYPTLGGRFARNDEGKNDTIMVKLKN
jgi:hypothetical protein